MVVFEYKLRMLHQYVLYLSVRSVLEIKQKKVDSLLLIILCKSVICNLIISFNGKTLTNIFKDNHQHVSFLNFFYLKVSYAIHFLIMLIKFASCKSTSII